MLFIDEDVREVLEFASSLTMRLPSVVCGWLVRGAV